MRNRHFNRFVSVSILSATLIIGALYWVLFNYRSLISDTTKDGFKRISRQYAYHDNLLQEVHPNKVYQYWALCVWNPRKDSIIFSRGTKPEGLKLGTPDINYSGGALFNDCLPGICFKYITHIDNGKIGYVQNAEQLKQFLGIIDNLEEALLLAEVARGVRVDTENIEGGSYQKDSRGYKLRLMSYNYCPQQKETIQLTINKEKGVVKTANLGIYFKGNGCIIF